MASEGNIQTGLKKPSMQMFSKWSLFSELAIETAGLCQAALLLFFTMAMDQRPSGGLLEISGIREQEVCTAVRSSNPHRGTTAFRFIHSHLDSIKKSSELPISMSRRRL